MKNSLSIVVALLCLCIMQQSIQAQNVDWAMKYGGAKKDKGRDLGVDQFGNTYVTGFFTDSATFGSTTLHVSGNQIDEDIFIAKFDPDGNALWAHSYGNGSKVHSDYPFGFSVNRDGYTLATGRCSGYIKFDNGDSIPAAGTDNMFMSVYDPNGNMTFTKIGGSLDETDLGTGGFIDIYGNLYCTGNFTGEGNLFGDVIFPDTIMQHHSYVICYNLTGQLQWYKVYSSETSLESREITGDNAGHLYWGGNFSGTMDFDGTKYTAKGSDDGYMVKLTTGGSFVYAKTFGSTDSASYESAYAIATDLYGNVYAATTFEHNINFDGNILSTGVIHNIGLVSFDQYGNFRWMNQIKGNADSSFFSVFCLGIICENNVIVSGNFFGIDTVANTIIITPKGNNKYVNDAFYAAFSPYDGEVQWALTAGGTNSDANYGLAGNNSGYAYGCGSFRGNGTFGDYNYQSNGESDMFLLKLEEGVATSVSDNQATTSLTAYPNPTLGQIKINIPSYANELKVMDALGRELMRINVKGNTNQVLDLKNYSSGIYFLQLNGETVTYTTRIVKE